MKFGPAIPHNPHGYTAKDGTHYPAVFPYAGDVLVDVQFRDGGWHDCYLAKSWDWRENFGVQASQIIAYRLPADHHAYGPKVSRMGREPDRVFNVYERWQFDLEGYDHPDRETADFNAIEGRIGIWRIDLKAQPE